MYQLNLTFSKIPILLHFQCNLRYFKCLEINLIIFPLSFLLLKKNPKSFLSLQNLRQILHKYFTLRLAYLEKFLSQQQHVHSFRPFLHFLASCQLLRTNLTPYSQQTARPAQCNTRGVDPDPLRSCIRLTQGSRKKCFFYFFLFFFLNKRILLPIYSMF